MPVEDPGTGEVLCEVADAAPQDGLAALAAADEAFAGWRDAPPRERSNVLRAAYELMIARTGDLTLLMTLEMGKPLAESRGEVVYAADFLRWYSEEAVRIDGRFANNEGGPGRVLVSKEPVGPCVFVTPWNFPLAMGTRKVGPALAAGCTVVVKPAPQTPLSMLAMARIFADAGLPAGVLNVVPTSRAAEVVGPLLRDPRARKLSFTGSTGVGRVLLAQAADQVLRVSMELGGNAPFLVFADADLDAAVEGAVVAKMRNGGEACTSANRFYVHDSVAEAFADRLADRLRAMPVGRGTQDGVAVGPLIDDTQRRKVSDLVQDAIERGAQVRTGGTAIDGPGHFYAPTVLYNVPAGAMLTEEIFGPVAPIVTFHDDDQALAAANATEFGLVAYLYTQDLTQALSVAKRLETGMVGLNQGSISNVGAPFGGIKHSGYGREGGPEGIHGYLNTKYVALAT